MAPHDMRQAVEKVRSAGEGGVLLTERGTMFGYNNLVVDMEGLAVMRAFAPVCFDATHSVQRPASAEHATGGDRRFIAPLARAAVGVGVDALFIEVHANPDDAPCDGPSATGPHRSTSMHSTGSSGRFARSIARSKLGTDAARAEADRGRLQCCTGTIRSSAARCCSPI
jgi:3-deoxy-8-phosphooctulonate synthase